MSKRIGMVGRYTEDEAREIVDRQARYQENLTYLAAESVRRRLAAAERLAEAAAYSLPDICAEEASGGTRGVCSCDLRHALAVYREASK